MPDFGSVQKFGVTCSDELRLTLMLVAIVFAFSPSWAARARSISARNAGASTSCCRWASATPLIAAMRWYHRLLLGSGSLFDAFGGSARCKLDCLVLNLLRLDVWRRRVGKLMELYRAAFGSTHKKRALGTCGRDGGYSCTRT